MKVIERKDNKDEVKFVQDSVNPMNLYDLNVADEHEVYVFGCPSCFSYSPAFGVPILRQQFTEFHREHCKPTPSIVD